ncbi:hypothetical protein CF54_18630 [Streptomyces sp. Tu 6176]|uniref:nuclear transport factor 2 family protein n=1 Tax=Streptomyces sp. Tu 6176 TaxID=1470557 RepID=UPI000451D185|nr:nuclear transport factor 2 family protein [Streptomyces sp. Tu 6176]EYT81593.1 hypothetical protein CF54_18630 [Streptomyces sp. Tu 6176]
MPPTPTPTPTPPPTTPPLTPEERRARNLGALRRYFALLAARDLDTWIGLWAEDCTQHVPYATGGLPASLAGRDEIRALYGDMAAGFTRLIFTRTEFHPLDDPDKVFACWEPRCELVSGGVYSNESVGLFEFDAAGRIRHFTEYFDPAGLVERHDAFGPERAVPGGGVTPGG